MIHIAFPENRQRRVKEWLSGKYVTSPEPGELSDIQSEDKEESDIDSESAYQVE